MRVDPSIEAPLRSALRDVINENPEAAGQNLAPLNPDQLTQALYYSWFAIGYVVVDVYGDTDGNWQREDPGLRSGSQELAQRLIRDVSPWFELGSGGDVAVFIEACVTGEMGRAIPEGVNVEQLPQLSVISAGYLLDRYRPEGKEWFEYLDQIWNFAEQQPAP